MPNFNNAILMGHMTRPPQTKAFTSGTSVTEFGLAVSKKYKEKETVLFIECKAWGRTGEVIAQYCDKGSAIFVQGEIAMDQWEKDGQKHSKIYLNVSTFQFVGGKSDRGQSPAPAPAPAPQSAPGAGAGVYGDEDPPFAKLASEVYP